MLLHLSSVGVCFPQHVCVNDWKGDVGQSTELCIVSEIFSPSQLPRISLSTLNSLGEALNFLEVALKLSAKVVFVLGF